MQKMLLPKHTQNIIPQFGSFQDTQSRLAGDTKSSSIRRLYKEGTFGHYWTVLMGRPDIEGETWFGNLNLGVCGITSLEGCPKVIYGNLDISHNKGLSSLEHCTNEIYGSFYCNDCNLKSLEYGPKKVGTDYNCSNNPLYTLIGAPSHIAENFVATSCKLITLAGSPIFVGRDFFVTRNNLCSLYLSPALIKGDYVASYNDLENLEQSTCRIEGDLHADHNKIRRFKNNMKIYGSIVRSNQDLPEEPSPGLGLSAGICVGLIGFLIASSVLNRL